VSGRSKDQDLIDELAAWMQTPKAETAQTNGHSTPKSTSGSTLDDVVARCRGAENAAKFSDLFDRGDVHTHHGGDDSRADLALLSMLTFWTQDEAQLERIFSSSALGQRDKWRNRDDYRKRTIRKALAGAKPGEVYNWGPQRGRPSFSSSHSPLGPPSDDENNESGEIVWFADLGEPKEREYLIEQIGVKGYPIVAFGAGGVAKSFVMLGAGIAIASASGADNWLGLRVLDHGYVLYLDFELDAEEQHRRVRDLCAGMGIPIPRKLAYLSGVGVDPDATFKKARAFVEHYKAKAAIIDSMGLAMQGDMEKGREVLAFHARYINPLRRAGATPFIVDHEGKLQTGEKHKDKTPFGSAYKAWASRSVLQFIFEEYREAASELDISVRQTKTNFGPKIEPLGLRFTFEEKKVSMRPYDLPDVELLDEESKPVRERILAALKIEPQTVPDLEKHTGAATGTIYNNLAQLIDAKEVAEDGYRGRKKLYRLFSSSPEPPRGSENDENEQSRHPTVAELFANPPSWLPASLQKYREDPQRHFKPLCTAVAAVVLGDSLRWEAVREDLGRELGKREEV
jgi:AAA domain